MSEKAKQIAVLFVGAVVIGGVITIQMRRARPVVQAPPGEPTEAVEANPSPPPVSEVAVSAPELPDPALALESIAGTLASAGASAATAEETAGQVALPPGEWGRNPFLTVAEILAAQPQPEPIQITLDEPILELPAAEPEPDLPDYRVSAIRSGEDGFSAIVDSRVVRTGDRLGSETITRITMRGVVLESNGRVRELLIERPGNAQLGPGGG